MGLADRDYVRDLHTLLRISRHVPDDELRYAYEQAMSAATRSGDLVRARTLSGAYEVWSRQRGAGVFGRTFATLNAPLPPPRTRGRAKSRPRRAPPAKCACPPTRVLYVLIVVPLPSYGDPVDHPPADERQRYAGRKAGAADDLPALTPRAARRKVDFRARHRAQQSPPSRSAGTRPQTAALDGPAACRAVFTCGHKLSSSTCTAATGSSSHAPAAAPTE